MKKGNTKKILKGIVWTSITLLIFARIGFEYILRVKGYFLLDYRIGWGINSIIIILAAFVCAKNKYLKLTEYAVLICLFIFNIKLLMANQDNKIIFYNSPNGKNELIIKENSGEVDKVKRIHKIFGYVNEKIETNDRILSKGRYKIKWLTDNIVTFTYPKGEDQKLQMCIYIIKDIERSSYYNVQPSIEGTWVDTDNKKNILKEYRGDFTYIEDGRSYNYDLTKAHQKGYKALILDGDNNAPDLFIVLNDDTNIGHNCLVNDDGSIFVGKIDLKNQDAHLFKKVK